MPRKKTPEEYLNECKDKGLDLPIEDYKGNRIKIKHKCKYGHIYEQTPTHHLNGSGCSICNGGKKYTCKAYVQKCKEKGYDLPVESYVNSSTKINHKCSKGHIYEQEPSSHLRGYGCPYCARNKKKSTQDYIRECKEKGYDLPIEDYKGVNVKIKHKCKYGHIYEQKPNTHLSGRGCYECKYNKYRFESDDSYLNYCKTKNLDIPISSYKNQLAKVEYRCSLGHTYKQTPSQHKYYGCPVCKESKGEKFIRNYLNEHSIKYISQKRFHDLKDKTYLSYDFYLPKQKVLIEYQGRQHYEENDFFGGKERFKQQQLHDKLKREYAKNNGYKLLELHYSLNNQEKVNKYLNRRIK